MAANESSAYFLSLTFVSVLVASGWQFTNPNGSRRDRGFNGQPSLKPPKLHGVAGLATGAHAVNLSTRARPWPSRRTVHARAR
jgi:hypothetical protein